MYNLQGEKFTCSTVSWSILVHTSKSHSPAVITSMLKTQSIVFWNPNLNCKFTFVQVLISYYCYHTQVIEESPTMTGLHVVHVDVTRKYPFLFSKVEVTSYFWLYMIGLNELLSICSLKPSAESINLPYTHLSRCQRQLIVDKDIQCKTKEDFFGKTWTLHFPCWVKT